MARLSKLSRSIEGKVALITGAASGMGRATAHLFADEGAHVAVTDVNAAGVADVVREIEDAGLRSHKPGQNIALQIRFCLSHDPLRPHPAQAIIKRCCDAVDIDDSHFSLFRRRSSNPLCVSRVQRPITTC